MLEGTYNGILEIAIQFVLGYKDSWFCFQEHAPLTHIHLLYTYMIIRLTLDNYSRGWSTDDADALRSKVWGFTTSFWGLLGPHCDNGLNTFKFHLLDHLVDDLDRFDTVSVLSAFPLSASI